MKLKHLFAGMLAFAALACNPVDDQPEVIPALDVPTKAFTVDAAGETVTLTFTTNQDWTVTPSEDWVSVDPASGAAAAEAVNVTVTVAASTVEAERTATVLVKAGELEETVTIAQGAYVVPEDGTEAYPYLIKTLEDLVAVRAKASLETPTYFRLENDIDMASVENWVPFNWNDDYKRQIHFDGNGKTISNFAPKTWNDVNIDGEPVAAGYYSLFGVLYGSCKNLTVVNAELTDMPSSSGIIAGYVGTQTAEGEKMPGLVSNVTVKGTITAKGDKVGGLAGAAYNATIEKCNVDVVITTSSTDCGGLIGKATGDLVVTDCNVKANITSSAASKNRVGGLIGWNSTVTTTITNCHVLEGSVLTDASGRGSASNGNYGGLIGFGDTTGTVLTISKSSATTVIEGGLGTYNGGFIGGMGYASTAVITDSWAKGSVVGDNYAGGFCGAVQNKSTIERCWADVEVSSTGQRSGSFIGTNTDVIVVKNCYSLGNATGVGQQISGLIGYDKVGATIECCYAAGDITSNKSGSAGLVGTMDGETSSVVKCIAWNKNIVCNRLANNAWAPGAIVGAVTKAKGKYADCYRRADMVLTDLAENGMTLFDQENVEGALPAAPSYSEATTQRAYHGKAAAADATCSSVAKSLGWDEAIWDLSGELPKLK